MLDAQPAPVRDAFHYRLCLLMVEAGKMRPVEKVPGETGKIRVFAATSGDHFSVVRPTLSRDQKAAPIDVLRDTLKDEDNDQ